MPPLAHRLKDLTAFNMERTITILGTIDNCKKAESLISAKLRASYESDMAQFIPVSSQTGGELRTYIHQGSAKILSGGHFFIRGAMYIMHIIWF